MGHKHHDLPPKYHYLPPERYPHTHYEIRPEWFGTYLGILRSWSFSLTHLGAEFAEKEADDFKEIYEELKDIAGKIDGWISDFTTAYTATLEAQKIFQNRVGSLAEELELLTETLVGIVQALYPVISDLLAKIKTRFSGIDTRLDDIDSSITNINSQITSINADISKLYEYIDDIYKIIENLISGGEATTTTLTAGTDYRIIYYNDFQDYTAGPPTLTLYEQVLSAPQHTFHSNRVHFSSTSSGGLTLAETIEPGVESTFQFRHGDDLATATYSYVFGIQFLRTVGDWISGSQTGSEIWNMNPRSARARWGVQCSPHWMSVNGVTQVLVCADTISDGFNSQYYNSYDVELTPQVLNLNEDLYFSYVE